MLNALIFLANIMMVLTSLFLICLVLIQRGKGGGLAGAFGGVGGSSAFGTKAGDVFTRVTIYVAIFWFLLALFLVYTSNSGTTTAFNKGVSSGSAVDDADLSSGKDKAVTDKDKAAAGDKAKVPAPATAVDKTTDATKPVTTPPTRPAEPANPANAGMKGTSPTTDLPSDPFAKTPKTP